MTREEALWALKGADRLMAATAEATLWSHWCRSGNAETDRLFRAGVEAMERRELGEAEKTFTRVIQMTPDFAEGWNKRATVRYLANDFTGAVADCRETIRLNPHHFAALSGQGLCHLSLGEYDEAAVCFRRALEINPHMEAARQNLSLAIANSSGGSGYLQ